MDPRNSDRGSLGERRLQGTIVPSFAELDGSLAEVSFQQSGHLQQRPSVFSDHLGRFTTSNERWTKTTRSDGAASWTQGGLNSSGTGFPGHRDALVSDGGSSSSASGTWRLHEGSTTPQPTRSLGTLAASRPYDPTLARINDHRAPEPASRCHDDPVYPISPASAMSSEPSGAFSYVDSISTPTRSSVGSVAPQLDSRRYRLNVIHHPINARVSPKAKDRRFVSPPPVLQLTLQDHDDSDPTDRQAIESPYNVVRCDLWRAPGYDADPSDCTEASPWPVENGPTETPSRPMLDEIACGSKISSTMVVPAPNERFDLKSDGPLVAFFAFPHIFIRQEGLYRLRFELASIGAIMHRPGGVAPILAVAWSDVFEAFIPKHYPGVQPASDLHWYLKGHGYDIGPIVRPGPRFAYKVPQGGGSKRKSVTVKQECDIDEDVEPDRHSQVRRRMAPDRRRHASDLQYPPARLAPSATGMAVTNHADGDRTSSPSDVSALGQMPRR